MPEMVTPSGFLARVMLAASNTLSVKVAFCNVGAGAIGTITFVGGYSPQIETPFGGDGEKLVNAIIAANFIVPQTLIGTSLLNGVGWLASLGATVGGNLMCIGKL